jgi:hypothetical protein
MTGADLSPSFEIVAVRLRLIAPLRIQEPALDRPTR